MSGSTDERRLAENEVIFRALNESVKNGVEAVNAAAEEAGSAPMHFDGTQPLFFYCECSSPTCTERIKITPDAYNTIHKARDVFTLVPGHNNPDIEDVTETTDEYFVVVKHVQPPTIKQALKDTLSD
jgi:hypothetical protein